MFDWKKIKEEATSRETREWLKLSDEWQEVELDMTWTSAKQMTGQWPKTKHFMRTTDNKMLSFTEYQWQIFCSSLPDVPVDKLKLSIKIGIGDNGKPILKVKY
jgi:hypothetical protein